MNFVNCLRSLVVAGLLLTISGCGQGMVEYTSKEGKFRVRMPEMPAPIKDPELPSSVKKVWLLQRSGSYSVAWEDLPSSTDSADKRLDIACDQVMKGAEDQAAESQGGHSRRQIPRPGVDRRGARGRQGAHSRAVVPGRPTAVLCGRHRIEVVGREGHDARGHGLVRADRRVNLWPVVVVQMRIGP